MALQSVPWVQQARLRHRWSYSPVNRRPWVLRALQVSLVIAPAVQVVVAEHTEQACPCLMTAADPVEGCSDDVERTLWHWPLSCPACIGAKMWAAPSLAGRWWCCSDGAMGPMGTPCTCMCCPRQQEDQHTGWKAGCRSHGLLEPALAGVATRWSCPQAAGMLRPSATGDSQTAAGIR